MTNELGFKELYEVSLKSTSNIEVNGVQIEPGETIASFDRIQIANFQEIKNIASANGGWDNSYGANLGAENAVLNASFAATYVITIDFVNNTISYDSVNVGA